MSIDRINTSGTPSVQRFYAQRTVQQQKLPPENKTKGTAGQAALYEFEPLQVPMQEPVRESRQASTLNQTSSTRSSLEPNLPPLDEIQSIAKQAGFIGLTERDIKRAYVLGESLLADYRA